MIYNMVVSLVLRIFCRLGSLFNILRFLWALYILYDAIFAYQIVKLICIGGRMIHLCSNCIE